MPLFGGYLFLFGAEEERVRCLTTNRISRVLAVEQPEQLVFDLRQFRQLIAANAPLTIESRLAPGRRVRVRQGAFAGVEGTVLETPRRDAAVGRHQLPPAGASVEIDDFLLEPLE